MTIATRQFQHILEQALSGELQLPEFQREYVWVRAQVVELFDSIRQKYPIGSFLFMERNPDITIEARPFEGTKEGLKRQTPDSFVLDGQQRITSGLALYYGVGPSNYYIDLEKLWTLAEEQKIDLTSSKSVATFLADLDNDDDYCKGRLRRSNPLELLDQHLLYTAVLADSFQTKEALKTYVERYPDRADFVDSVVREGFRLQGDIVVPVTVVERDRPVEAVSRIFATLNTTGRPLTPFELVVALLYPAGVRLRSDIEENRGVAPHYDNMDKTGEVFLQTIAMLAGESPKKSKLPKTIKPTIYKRWRNDAVEMLEELGEFLTDRLGVGLDQSGDLVPYDSIFAPMALAFRHIADLKLSGTARLTAEKKLQKWFLAAALGNRYQEGVHNKQDGDRAAVMDWIEGKEEPGWIANLRIPSLLEDSPDGAVGKLMRCLINAKKPIDPVLEFPVGLRSDTVPTEKHHLFPTKFCSTVIPEWDNAKDTANLALNITFLSRETNGRWINFNPADQLAEMEANHTKKWVAEQLRSHLLDDACVDVMRRPTKTKSDFRDFLEARQTVFYREFENWGLLPASE